jgi:putative aldouronate transport system substrate-binding protein
MRGAMLLEPFKQPMETVFPNLYFDTAVAEEVGRLKIAISDYQNEAVARFITGQLDVDKDWDSYKKQLSNIGLDRYMALNQDAYSKSAFSKR